jgi:rod shape-determining protein MreC
MQNLLRFFLRYHFTILFILIEALALLLLLQNNNYQNTRFVDFTRNLKGNFYEQTMQVEQYLNLREKNQQLVRENEYLRNYIESNLDFQADTFRMKTDTVYDQQFYYLSARVINNSVNKMHNYITLDKGREDGVKPEMGVTSGEGVVGVVRGVSDHFSTAISLLNSELRVSAKLGKSGYYGPLNWTGRDYQYAKLMDIPLHADVNQGDSVITSGYSAIFPEGILLGYVEDYQEKGGRFYEVDVKLSTDFKKLSHVYIVKNLMREEQDSLEMNLRADD